MLSPQQSLLGEDKLVKTQRGLVMNIAIIGAGNVGKALAGSFKRAGHQVTITAKHPEHAADAALATGTLAAASNAEAIAGSDLVVLAVPETALEALAAEISDAAHGKVVVDVLNRPTPNPAGAPTSASSSKRPRTPSPTVRSCPRESGARSRMKPQAARRCSSSARGSSSSSR